MRDTISRRRFVMSSAAGAMACGAIKTWAEAPQILARSPAKPLVIASANGNISKDAAGLTCVTRAFKMITEGADVLDAVVAGVNIVELDPEDTSVGYGGLPNADGVVQLDACVMHGPLKRAGGVACLEGVKTPASVAKKVMEETDHVLLVGRDARAFARNVGFKIEDDLNTEKSRKLWMEWKRRVDPQHYLDPKKRVDAGLRTGRQMVAEGLIDPNHFYGTINCNAMNAKGEICGTTTTSGLSFKIPGRVGDSPIIGAGLYIDNAVGAAGSTGRGEANLYNLSSYFIVECMRQGMSPKDAGMAAIKRIVANTVEKRLLNSRGLPNFNVAFYVFNVKGEYAGVSLYTEATKYSICTEAGPELVPIEPMFDGKAEA